MNMKDKLLFIDTETGGLNPDKHSLLSLAMVVWQNKELIDSQEILIKDGQLSVTEEALSINKIDIENHKKLALPSSQAFERCIKFISQHFPDQKQITLAGHNVHFDVAFLKVFFSQNNTRFSTYFSHRIIDTSSILYYLHLAGHLKEKAISSDEAFALFNIQVDGRHTALGDAVATAELFNKLLDLTKMWSKSFADIC